MIVRQRLNPRIFSISGLGKIPARLVEQPDFVSGTNGSFDQDCGVDSGFAIVGPGDALHHVRIGLGGFGVEGDHFAARVAVDDGKNDFLSDAKGVADELIFAESVFGVEIEIDVRAKTAFVE